MDKKLQEGAIAESIITTYFLSKNYFVFKDCTGKAAVDLIILDEDLVPYTVEVKSSTYKNKSGKYEVQLKRVRANRTGSTLHNFDNSTVDYLAVYFPLEQGILVKPANEITTKTILTVNPKDIWRIGGWA